MIIKENFEKNISTNTWCSQEKISAKNIINQDVSIYILRDPDSLDKSCQHQE